MRRILVAAVVAALPLTPLAAQSMPVSDFLAKADALQKRGPMALFSSDIGKLKAEIVNSGKQLRIEQATAQRAGRKPAVCMPKKGKASINSNELLAHFRAMPPAQRSITVKAAFAGLMRKNTPAPPVESCPVFPLAV